MQSFRYKAVCYKDQQRYKKYIYVHQIQYTWLKQDPYFYQIREKGNIKDRQCCS